MKLYEAAIHILREQKKTLNPRELWSEIERCQLFKSNGDTPWSTLSTELRRKTEGIDHKRQDYKKFFYLEDGRFGLLEWRENENYINKKLSKPVISIQNKIAKDIDELSQYADSDGDFDFKDAVDAREKTLRSVALRRGQSRFRENLLAAYESTCAISGCTVKAVLEAAHIVPYFGKEANHICNGILLRSDIHLLFDQMLLTIEPDSFTVKIHPSLQKTYYEKFDNVKIFLPNNHDLWPSQDALRERKI